MRPIWTGTITFALVNIPVKVYSMVQDEALDLDMLHAKDKGRIRFVRMCEKEHKEVPYNEIVRGFEVAKGEYVVLSEEDFKAASVSKTQSITIDSFVDADEVDPVYFEKPYALEPAKGGERTYALLRQALEKSGKVGIANFVFRNHGHVGVVRPYGKALIVNQIRFEKQIRSLDELKIAVAKPKDSELKIAADIIKAMAGTFEPSQYHDEYRDALERVIKAKAKGKTFEVEAAPDLAATKLSDLMEALKKSLETKPRRGARRVAPARAASTRRRAKSPAHGRRAPKKKSS